MKTIANTVIALMMIWALGVSFLAFLDITVHWPWVITETDTEAIPFHRLQAIRIGVLLTFSYYCLLYTSPSPRDAHESRMPSSA